MDKILCCFPMETKARDLDSRLYQALICIKRNKGFSALIGKKSEVNRYMFRFNIPFLYFAKGMNNHLPTLEFWSKIHKCGGKIIYLDEEGGPSKSDDDEFMLRYTKEALEYTNLICAWGENQMKIILKHRKDFSPKKIVVTGHPRFDLKKQSFRTYFEGLLENKIEGDYILFNLNFAFVNSHLSPVQMMEYLRQDTIKRIGRFNDNLYKKIFNYELAVRRAFITAIRDIALNSKCKLIVRPHPSEDKETYLHEFKDLSNVIITNEGSAHEWIINAKLIIHHDCTTAIETFFYGKNPIAYLPVECNKDVEAFYVNRLPIEVSTKVTSKEALICLIEQIENNGLRHERDNLQFKTELVKKVFSNVDFNAAEVIAKEAERIAKEPDIKIPEELMSFANKATGYEKSIQKIRTFILENGNFFYTKLFSSKKITEKSKDENHRRRSIYKFPGLEFSEVKHRVDLLRSIENEIPEVKILKIGEDTFLLESVN